jgi:hypothetical protein
MLVTEFETWCYESLTLRYIELVAKSMTKASKLNAAVRKTAVKPARYPEGYGALQGQFVIRPGLDLTKPIYEQVLGLDKKERRRPTL